MRCTLFVIVVLLSGLSCTAEKSGDTSPGDGTAPPIAFGDIFRDKAELASDDTHTDEQLDAKWEEYGKSLVGQLARDWRGQVVDKGETAWKELYIALDMADDVDAKADVYLYVTKEQFNAIDVESQLVFSGKLEGLSTVIARPDDVIVRCSSFSIAGASETIREEPTAAAKTGPTKRETRENAILQSIRVGEGYFERDEQHPERPVYRVAIVTPDITNEDLAEVAKLDQLKELLLTSAIHITDDGIARLKGLERLEFLRLVGAQMSDVGAANLKQMQRMKRLHLERTQIGDLGLAQLQGMTELRDLDLVDTNVTDAGLEHLQAFELLEELNLASTKITDKGLPKLAALTNLKVLTLVYTDTSREAAERLQEALPQTKIYPSEPMIRESWPDNSAEPVDEANDIRRDVLVGTWRAEISFNNRKFWLQYSLRDNGRAESSSNTTDGEIIPGEWRLVRLSNGSANVQFRGLGIATIGEAIELKGNNTLLVTNSDESKTEYSRVFPR